MGKSAGPAPKPDPAIGEAALKQANLGEEWLSFSKDAFKVSTGMQSDLNSLTRKVMDKQIGLSEDQQAFVKKVTNEQMAMAREQQALAKKVTNQQLEQSDWLFDQAQEDRDRYETVFRPIEDEFVDEAKDYATEARQTEAAAEAKADVLAASDASRKSAERQAASMGIDPRSGRFAGINRGGELSTALASSGAQNNARQRVRDKGLALKADVVNLGKGLPAQAASQTGQSVSTSSQALSGSNQTAGLGINAGNSAISGRGNAANLGINAYGLGLSGRQQAQQSYVNSTGIVGQGFGGAMQGYGNQANTLQNQYDSQLSAWNTQQQLAASNAMGLGKAIGGIAGMFSFTSDEDKKTDKEPIEEGDALEAVNDLDVEEWTYKEGVADEGRHVGPYAQDFQRETGKGDGTMIKAQDAIGITMKAVQDLDDKVDDIVEAVGIRPGQPARKPAKRKPAPKQARQSQPQPANTNPEPTASGLGIRRAA